MAENTFLQVMVKCIVGLPGVGKTSLAIEFASRNQKKFFTYFFSARDHQDLKDGICAFLSEFSGGLSSSFFDLEDRNLYENFKKHLQLLRPFLLIFDDAWDPDEILNKIPSTGGIALLTSKRRPEERINCSTLQLQAMKEDEGAEFLATLIPHPKEEKKELATLAKELGCFPLALAQVAAYLRRLPSVSIGEYLQSFQKRRDLLLTREASQVLPKEYQSSVEAAFDTVFEKAESENRDAPLLLQTFGYLAANQVPFWVLEEFLMRRKAEQMEMMEGGKASPFDQLKASLSLLETYCLVEVNYERQKAGAHNLTRAFSRERVKQQEKQNLNLSLLLQIFKETLDSFQDKRLPTPSRVQDIFIQIKELSFWAKSDPELSSLLGEIYLALGDLVVMVQKNKKEATFCYFEALRSVEKLPAKYTSLQFIVGKKLLWVGAQKESIDLFSKVFDALKTAHPNNSEVYEVIYEITEALLIRGMVEESKRFLSLMEEIMGPEDYLAIGELLLWNGESQECFYLISRALKLLQESTLSSCKFAAVLLRAGKLLLNCKGRSKEALERISKAKEKMAESRTLKADDIQSLGFHLIWSDCLETGVTYFEELVQNCDSQKLCSTLLGIALVLGRRLNDFQTREQNDVFLSKGTSFLLEKALSFISQVEAKGSSLEVIQALIIKGSLLEEDSTQKLRALEAYNTAFQLLNKLPQPSESPAQWENPAQKAALLFEIGVRQVSLDPKEASLTFQKALELNRSEAGQSRSQRNILTFWLARSFIPFSADDSRKLIMELESKLDEKDKLLWLTELAECYEAFDSLHQAGCVYEKLRNMSSCPMILLKLIRVYCKAKNFAYARKEIKEYEEKCSELFANDLKEHCKKLELLANLLLELSLAEEAKGCIDHSLKLVEEIYGTMVNMEAVALLRKGTNSFLDLDPNVAMHYFAEEIKILSQLLGPHHKEVIERQKAFSLNLYAKALFSECAFTLEELLKLELDERTELEFTMMQGDALKRAEDKEKARLVVEKALRLASKFAGPSSSEVHADRKSVV